MVNSKSWMRRSTASRFNELARTGLRGALPARGAGRATKDDAPRLNGGTGSSVRFGGTAPAGNNCRATAGAGTGLRSVPGAFGSVEGHRDAERDRLALLSVGGSANSHDDDFLPVDGDGCGCHSAYSPSIPQFGGHGVSSSPASRATGSGNNGLLPSGKFIRGLLRLATNIPLKSMTGVSGIAISGTGTKRLSGSCSPSGSNCGILSPSA